MRKSMIILIAVVYVLAIFIVGFYGLRIHVVNELISVEEITCTNEELTESGFEDLFVFNYKTGGTAKENSIQLLYNVLPANASKKDVIFIYDTSQTFLKISGTGFINFYGKGITTLTIKSTDGSDVQLTFDIWAK